MVLEVFTKLYTNIIYLFIYFHFILALDHIFFSLPVIATVAILIYTFQLINLEMLNRCPLGNYEYNMLN
jgi:hypothetical protein